jgi:hypothetical protein
MSRRVLADRLGQHDRWSQDLAAPAFLVGRVHSGVEGHDGRVAEGGGEPVDLGSEAHELGGGAFGDERFGVADPEQQLPV